MKKSILLSLFFMLFASYALMAQDEEAAVEELKEPPSMDDLLERPKDITVVSIDDFKNSAFNFYDEVIRVRKEGEANGWDGQGISIVNFKKQGLKLIKSTALMAKDIKSVPKLKLIGATKSFIASKKAISHSMAHINYMMDQFSPEDLKELESQAKADEAQDGDGGK